MKKGLTLGLLLLGLIVTVAAVRISVRFFSHAEGNPANIIVDTAINQGPINPIWKNLAQGGEERYPFTAVINQLSLLSPRYIRIDHIYDFYEVVSKDNRQLIFDWVQLDKQIKDILATGALPFLSLSYMPPSIAVDGVITNQPVDWNDWSLVVQRTIEHFSGREGWNLPEVIYEVWNEPDLFGSWRLGGNKDYLQLYHYAIMGAQRVVASQTFKIGGPGITAPYKNWVGQFLDYVVENNLRLDFYSWHRYSYLPTDYLEDVDAVDTWLFNHAGYTLEKYLTEWGPTSENLPIYNTDFAAAHLLATVSQLIQRVDLAFAFEVKDGPPVSDTVGRYWGILTHEAAGPVKEKPRYQAIKLLNQISGNRIGFTGAGTWVTGFAAKEGGKIKILLVNLDLTDRHFEDVPLSILNLDNGSYQLKLTTPAGETSYQQTIANGQLQGTFSLKANQWLLLGLEKAE